MHQTTIRGRSAGQPRWGLPIVALCAGLLLGACQLRPGLPQPLTPGSGQGLYVLPDDGPGPLWAAIEGARESIAVVTYLISDDDTVEALSAAHRRGVDVRVMMDASAFEPGAVGRADIARLQAAGVPVRPGNEAFRLTHQKTVVVDGHTALILNMNLSASGLRRNREYNVVDRDPAHVAEIARVFDADWHRATDAPSAPGLVWSPDNARARLTEHLRAATSSVDVATELFTDRALMDELVTLAGRGVAVRVLLPPVEHPGDENERALADLGARGVRIRRLDAPFMHAKLVLVDGRRAFVGSQNLTYSGLERNRELGVLVTDPAIVERAAAVYEGDWRRAR